MSIDLNFKTILFYYSATGNSLWVAKQLQASLTDCSLLPIVGCLKKGKQEVNAQVIGLVFPIHKFGIPEIIRDFLKTAKVSPNSYVFAVITGANPRLSAGIFQFRRLLKQQNQSLNAGFHIRMPATYFPLIRKRVQPKSLLYFTEVITKLNGISALIQNGANRVEPGIRLLSGINKMKLRKTNIIIKRFYVNDGCIRCGYCVMVCPQQNISILNSRPVIENNCNTCFACVHFCSQGVLQYGNRTPGRQRYHHPAITIGQLKAQKS